MKRVTNTDDICFSKPIIKHINFSCWYQFLVFIYYTYTYTIYVYQPFIITLVSDEIFDGFICYAKEDRSFALEILRRLEDPPYCRKICIDFRDYVPGNCRLDQTAKIIEHRCKHLVAILSPNFTNSSNAGFQVRIALNLSPGESNAQRQ